MMKTEATTMIFFITDLPNSKTHTMLIPSLEQLKTFNVCEQTNSDIYFLFSLFKAENGS